MKLYTHYIFLLIFTVFTIGVKAQSPKSSKPVDFGIILGVSNYMGELAKPVAINETHPMGGLILRYNFSSMLTLRASASFGRISGDDKNYDSDNFRKRRNLSFRSNIMEFAGTFEFNFGGFANGNNMLARAPYLFAGLAIFKYNPKAYFEYIPAVHDAIDNTGSLKRFDKSWIELQPLSTEGQESTKFNNKKRYPLTQISIPFGIGYKFNLDEDWTLGIEGGVRKTFTDYLDDVSTVYIDDQIVGGANGFLAVAMKDRSAEVGQIKFENGEARGNSKAKDWYMMIGFTLTKTILGGRQACPTF